MTPQQGVDRLNAAIRAAYHEMDRWCSGSTCPPPNLMFPALYARIGDARKLRDALSVLVKKGVSKLSAHAASKLEAEVTVRTAAVNAETDRLRVKRETDPGVVARFRAWLAQKAKEAVTESLGPTFGGILIFGVALWLLTRSSRSSA